MPDFLVMAAPFTPFKSNGDVNTVAILPLAALFKETLGVNAVWVMGMRGQYDALSTFERKAVAEAWVHAGRAHRLFVIIQVGDSCQRRAAEMAAHAEQIGADAIGALGPYEELCSNTKCVVDFLAPVGAAAPKTPFFYYHTPGWNGKGLNGVKMYDWFQLAATAIPTAVGVKFESYDDGEFAQTCKQYGSTKLMLYAPCDSLGHWEQKTPGRGAFIQAFLAPMCHRIRAAFQRGDTAAMRAELSFRDGCQNAGGNFIERYFYAGFGKGMDMGHPRPPQPRATTSELATMNRTLHSCGFFKQSWPSASTNEYTYIV